MTAAARLIDAETESAIDTARIMWVIFLEMGAVLALIALILWWTWPTKRRHDRERDS